jgi:hypothetical protein
MLQLLFPSLSLSLSLSCHCAEFRKVVYLTCFPFLSFCKYLSHVGGTLFIFHLFSFKTYKLAILLLAHIVFVHTYVQTPYGGNLANQHWLTKWRFKANSSKSTHITFTTRRATCSGVHIYNEQLPQAEEVKYLGLHLDRRLTWYKHIFAKRKHLGITLSKMY